MPQLRIFKISQREPGILKLFYVIRLSLLCISNDPSSVFVSQCVCDVIVVGCDLGQFYKSIIHDLELKIRKILDFLKSQSHFNSTLSGVI